MAKTVELFFSVLSAYTYLAIPRLKEMAARHGAKIVARPMDIMAVIEAAGGIPPARQHDARKAWRRADLARWGAHLGMPITLPPKHWPVPAALASQSLLAAIAAGADPLDASFAFLRAVWVEDRDISDPATIAAILDTQGLDGAALLAAAPAHQEAFAANTADAIARGVLGAPTFVIGDEMLWGQDRLLFVEKALAG